MNRTVEFLSRFCREHRLDKKYLICPSYKVGRQIGESLAKEGENWVNLHFMTLSALAQQIVGAELSRTGMRLLSKPRAFFLVEKIFRRLKNEAELDYFGKIEATTGIVRALENSIFELRMAGLKSRDLEPWNFIDERKGREVKRLLRAYEDELHREKLIDLPGLYELALKQTSAGRQKRRAGIYGGGEWYIALRDRPLDRLEREFLSRLAGENLILVPQDPVYGLIRPRRMWDGGTDSPAPSEVPPGSSVTNIERLPWLFATAKAPPPVLDGSIDIFSAIGPTNECREILRRVTARKIPFDDVEIVHPPNSSFPSIMYSLAAKSGLAVTFADGIPIAFTGPGKVFSGLIHWLESGYLVSDLCALLEAGAVKFPPEIGDVALTPFKASRYLKSAMIGWGRERYVKRLQTLIQDAEESARAAESEGEFERSEKFRATVSEIESLAALVKSILALFPLESEDGKVDFAALCRGASSFIGRFAAVYGELDAEALGLLESRLNEGASSLSGSSGAPVLQRQAAFEWLRDLASGLRVGASGPLPGHLHLSNWRTGGFSGRPETFVVGLDQATFPGSGIQDPILLDDERQRISKDLRTSDESLRENLWSMAGMLSGLRGRVTLSYSAYDIIEERESFPSSLVLQAARLKEGKPDLDYSALDRLIPEARGFLPEGEIESRVDEMDWWLGKLASGGILKDGMEAVKINFHLLGRGIFAQERRGKPKVSEFEGKIEVDPKELHPLHNRNLALSASRLEKLAECPFAYLMRYVLEVIPPEELELDQSQWSTRSSEGRCSMRFLPGS